MTKTKTTYRVAYQVQLTENGHTSPIRVLDGPALSRKDAEAVANVFNANAPDDIVYWAVTSSFAFQALAHDIYV